MKTSLAFIVLAGIVLLLCIKVSIKKTTEKELRIDTIATLIGCSLFVALLINGASNTIYSIDSTEEYGHTDTKYLLFYRAKIKDKAPKLMFLPPFGKNYLQNNTGEELVYYPIKYGKVKNEYNPEIIPPYSITKIESKPTYYFESVPSTISYSSRYSSSGITKWIVLKQGEEIQYIEPKIKGIPIY